MLVEYCSRIFSSAVLASRHLLALAPRETLFGRLFVALLEHLYVCLFVGSGLLTTFFFIYFIRK